MLVCCVGVFMVGTGSETGDAYSSKVFSLISFLGPACLHLFSVVGANFLCCYIALKIARMKLFKLKVFNKTLLWKKNVERYTIRPCSFI